MDSMTYVEEYRDFLEYFKAHVDPLDQLPVRIPGYNLLESEIDAEVINWVLQYLLQMKCPQVLLPPIINEAVQETRKSYTKLPKQCGYDGYAYNPLKLSAIVISHTNGICERLLDNAELNEMLTKSSASVLEHTPRHCVKAIKNTRRKMEDRHVCISDFNGLFAVKDSEPTSFYGVFDGHGGQDAAFFTAAHLCYNIANSSKYPDNIDEAIKESFLKTDAAFIDKSDKHALYCGTTALACLYRAAEKRLFVGWVGDSQALLVCEGKVFQIVSPHVPSLESESKRIEKMGGVVLNWNGVYRVNGQLAVSRAIGDAQFKPFITGEPDTSTISLEGTEDFLIIASDGLWESLSEDYIALFIYRKIAENPDCVDSIADKLVESARQGTTDNITIVIVFFKDPHLIAKSSWLNKMEAAYDKNNSNSAFDNDASHFKFSNADGGFNISSDMPVTNDSDEHQMISSPTLVKKCYDESSDVHITDESVDVVDNHQHQRFEDDFGPETDVDAMDDNTNFTKSPIDPQTNENNNEFSLSNGIKPFSLENKIIQQLSEQNRDFLTDSNPFKNDHFDQFSDEQSTKISDDSSAEVVDNKIIDALESLAVNNGENEKHEFEDEKQERDLLDIRQPSPDVPDLTEKTDYVHEKHMFMEDAAAQPDDTFIPHSDSTFNQTEIKKSSLIEQEDTPILADTRCVDESVGEESEEEEEEDEWNYIKGDKKSEEKQIPSAAEIVANPEQLLEIQSSESVVEGANTVLTSEPQLLDFSPGETVQKVEEEEVLGEKIDETKDGDIPETEDTIIKTEEPVREAPDEQSKDTAVSIEQELADYENNVSAIAAASSGVEPSFENPDPVPLHEELNLDSAPNLLLAEVSPSEPVAECPSPSEVLGENEQPPTAEVAVEEDQPFADIGTEEAAQSTTEIVPEETPSMNVAEEDSNIPSSTEVVLEEKNQESEEQQTCEVAKETSVDEELERPDSLSLEMASKLNPEAKEFVPVSSPNRSNPTSPVANAPSSMVPNSFLMLEDDTVVAQSPKKFTTSMDNIDVPAEDDFQHDVNIRPHELEKPAEYINGNAEAEARSHSPASEPSYQELNLKEAMQGDEKLEHDYNDEKQIVPEDSSTSDDSNDRNISNLLNRDQDRMNMSFYEGRDEGLLSNSDELNKVHMLPEGDDEMEEQSNDDDTDKVHADMSADLLTPTDSKDVRQLLDDKMDIVVEPEENESQPTACEEQELPAKSPAPEEAPSAAIYAVASQVVNDVAALVEQMQIEPPAVANDTDLVEEHDERLRVEEPLETEPTEITTTESEKLEEPRDILVSLELQKETKPFLEDALDIGHHTESPSPNPTEHTAETEELVSPLVESLQQEVVAENEFITDESVLNVQSPAKSMFSAEAPTAEPEPVLKEPVKQPVPAETTESSAVEEPSVERGAESTATTPSLLDTVPVPIPEPVAAAPPVVIDKVIEQLKPAVAAAAATKSATTKPAAAKSPASTKPTAPKTMTAKTSKPASAPTVEKKTTAAARLSAKPATTKPTTTSKPLTTTTSTVKKTSSASSASSTRTSGTAAKPPSASTTTTTARSSTTGSATSKLSAEKKAPLTTVRKTTATATTAVNGEVKTAAKKSTTTLLKSTTVASKSSTSSTSTTSAARPSSTTSVRSTVTAKPSTMTTKSSTSAPAKPSSTGTTRTSSTVPTAKPRTVPTTASRTASSTASATSTTTSKPSSNAITKRVSTVGTAASRTTTSTVTSKTTTALKTTSSAASRTSTVSKTSTTTVTGVRKTSGGSPTKKPVSSPASKTTPPSTKAAASTKKVTSPHANGKVATEVATTTDLLDLSEKQFKNDNNQLITNNGLDSQMMVIDSAAD